MPLEHSSSPAAFKRNVSTLMHEVGKSPHVQSPRQALAISYATQRRAEHGRAMGGVAPNMAARMPLRPPMPGLGAAGNAMPIGVAAPGNVMGGPLRRADGGLSAMTGAMKMGQLNSMDRFEMRGGGMMHGPLLSASPGRADKH